MNYLNELLNQLYPIFTDSMEDERISQDKPRKTSADLLKEEIEALRREMNEQPDNTLKTKTPVDKTEQKPIINREKKKDSFSDIKPKYEVPSYNKAIQVSKTVTSISDDAFLVYNTLGNNILSANPTEITFYNENSNEDVFGRKFSGITENDLISILLYRNRNNKERYDIIKRLFIY